MDQGACVSSRFPFSIATASCERSFVARELLLFERVNFNSTLFLTPNALPHSTLDA